MGERQSGMQKPQHKIRRVGYHRDVGFTLNAPLGKERVTRHGGYVRNTVSSHRLYKRRPAKAATYIQRSPFLGLFKQKQVVRLKGEERVGQKRPMR